MVDVHESVKHAVDGLFRKDVTLLSVKRTHNFELKTLSYSTLTYSASLKFRVEVKIEEKRNTCLVHLLEYLHDPIFLTEINPYTFGEYGNKTKICGLAETLMQRLLGVARAWPWKRQPIGITRCY